MAITSITSRDFNQDVSQAKRAAAKGPVVITDRGKPAYVLLRHDSYRALLGQSVSIRQMLDHAPSKDFAFDPPKLGTGIFRTPDLS
jgi:antitoxin (DNA-binding transcriptional repressor) of toxin-antitoxin stability system